MNIKKYYDKLKIKEKLTMAHLLIVLLVSFVSWTAFQLSFGVYNNLLYQSSAQVLQLSTNQIESELRKMDSYSYNLLSDKNVQQKMIDIKYETNAYQQYNLVDELLERFLIYVASERNISTIYFIDTQAGQHPEGINPVSLAEDVKNQTIHSALEAGGNSVIIDEYAQRGMIILARQFRSTAQLSLENLGVVAFRLELSQLGDAYVSNASMKDSHLFIFSENNLVYKDPTSENIQLSLEDLNADDGFSIKTIDGKKYFLTYSTSNYTNWTYVNVIGYNEAFNQIERMRILIVLVFIGVFVLGSVISVLLAKSITKPIMDLTLRMKRVETGDFSEVKIDSHIQEREDEIGTLHKDFELMISRINTLIDENFKKQIVIKDTNFKALQAQINPHFLYNTLESINWLAKANHQEEIATMVKALGKLLRNAVNTDEFMITIGEELELLDAYISIQKYRYEERLVYRSHVNRSFWGIQIPKLTLQPLVENAIVHSLENMLEPCEISVHAKKQEGMIMLYIQDNGLGIEEKTLKKLQKNEPLESRKGMGIGVQNIDERLKMTFGSEYGLFITSNIGEGTRIEIRIPEERKSENV
ncbi:sensor histidine kinase [Vallitaleaceae bacterium 9-2]